MNRRTLSFLALTRTGTLALLISLLAVSHGSAQASAPSPTGPTDRKELEAFLDKFFAEQMQKQHIPGAVFVLVKDGEIFFAKGYGYANLEKKTPVEPDKTLFRVGSVSKLFTATAVMQLIEQGKLNLDDDVNNYLKLFQLDSNYPRPVTVANLLTHTGGFDERIVGMAARTDSDLIPMGQYLAERMPPRVMPPGDVISYSNHGMALLGYLVEVISGVPFAQYVDENILKPLGMTHSSFLLPPQLAPDLAVGYLYTRNTYQAVPFDYLNKLAPAGSFNTTGADMARFMIAHLQDGRYADVRILQEATAQEMHRQHFTHHPRLPGWAYGFYQQWVNGQRALAHGGDWIGFGSLLFLLPERNLGFFVSANNDELRLRDALVHQFLDHYYPVREKPALTRLPADFLSRAHRFTGSYRVNRYARHTIEKLASLLQQGRLTASPDGTLVLRFPPALQLKPERWVEVEPLLFQRADGEGTMAFREDAHGRITDVFMSLLGIPMAFEKLAWYESAPFHLGLLAFCVLLFLSACLGWPVADLIRRWRKKPSQATPATRRSRCLAGLVSALNLVFLVGLILIVASDPIAIAYGMPRALIALLCIPLLTAALTVGLLIVTLLAWKNRYGSVAGRLHYSLVTLAALAFIPFLHYYNLLGFHY